MSGWLPPGCTDADIDRAANGPEPRDEDDEPELYQCDCCGDMWPVDLLVTIAADKCSAGTETTACPKCRAEHGLVECEGCGKRFKPDAFWCPIVCADCTQEGPDMPDAIHD